MEKKPEMGGVCGKDYCITKNLLESVWARRFFLCQMKFIMKKENINIDESIEQEDNLSITIRFSQLVKLYSSLDFKNETSYLTFASAVFNLGYALGFNIDDIFTAYNKKVLKNHQVQDEFNN